MEIPHSVFCHVKSPFQPDEGFVREKKKDCDLLKGKVTFMNKMVRALCQYVIVFLLRGCSWNPLNYPKDRAHEHD